MANETPDPSPRDPWTYEKAPKGFSVYAHQQAIVTGHMGYTVATCTIEDAPLICNAPDLQRICGEMLALLDNPYREGDRGIRDRARDIIRRSKGRP